MFNEHIAPVIEAEAKPQAPRSHLRRRHGVKHFFPVYTSYRLTTPKST